MKFLMLVTTCCAVLDCALSATVVEVDPAKPIKDLSSQPCGFGLGFNGDLAHEHHTRAQWFFERNPEQTAMCFRDSAVRLVRAGTAVVLWQGDRANRIRFYERWKHVDFGRSVLDMSKPWHWIDPRIVYDFYRNNGIKVLPCLSSRVYDPDSDAMSGDVGLVKKTTLAYLDWLKANGYADNVIGFELDNEPYLDIPDPQSYVAVWRELIPEIKRMWPDAKLGLPVAIYLKGDPDLVEVRRRLVGNDLLSGKRSEERINQWTGNVIAALGDVAKHITHLCIHVYGAGRSWNCNYNGIRRTDKLREVFPVLKGTRTWITEWRDQSDNDYFSQRRFRTLLWKADYILMALAQPEVDAIFQHSLYGHSGAIYWSTGREWYFQPERPGVRKFLADANGDGNPRMVRGACGALYRLLFDAFEGRTLLLGVGAARGVDTGAVYYDSIVRHDRALRDDPPRDLPFDGDCLWAVATDAGRMEGTLVAVNTHGCQESVSVGIKGRRIGTADCRVLKCRADVMDQLEIPGETPPWRVDICTWQNINADDCTFFVPPFSVFVARFPLH